jgi:hypothetical protein
MAITGTKQWVAAEVVTAADVNQYLMRGVKVFASAAVRDAAYGGAGEPTLEEGEVCYLLDTNAVMYYTGSAWANVATAADDDQAILASQVFS